MGNCTSVPSDDEEQFPNSPPQTRTSHQTSPQNHTNGFNNGYPQHQQQQQYIYTIPAMPAPQQQVETIDSNGFTVLSQNPHLRYKANMLIQSDEFLGKIYFGYLCDKKVHLKEFKSKQSINQEVAILSPLDHLNIVKFLMKFDALNQRFFMLTEHAEKLNRNFHLKNDDNKKDAMMQLAKGVQYLQKSRIAHCQIIPQSVFVVNHENSFTFKLGNFTRARKLKANWNSVNGEYLEKYSAPEIHVKASLCLASDIWSLGCLYFYLAFDLELPLIIYENQMGQITAPLRHIKVDLTSPILLSDLLKKMLKYQPNQRLSAIDVQSHPYFWDAKEMTDLIVDVSRFIEKDDKQQWIKILNKGSHRVYGESWTAKLDEEVLKELQAIKKSYNNRGGKKNDFNEKSMTSLCTTIRNIIVHSRSPKIVQFMGEDDEQLMDYWNDKFPYLIEHIYNAKQQYENKENIN